MESFVLFSSYRLLCYFEYRIMFLGLMYRNSQRNRVFIQHLNANRTVYNQIYL